MAFFFRWIVQYGYLALFMSLMLGMVGLPMPDEMLLIFAGYLIFHHEFALLPTIAAAVLGSACGITLSYGLGRTLGSYLVKRMGHSLHLDPQQLSKVQAWYGRRGKYTLLFGYFVPGFRHLTAYVAGSSKVPLAVFAPFAYTGGLLWSVTFITLGYFFGEEWMRMTGTIHQLLIIGFSIVFVALIIFLVIIRRRAHAR
jgi:membrane protein DedA with SNARE-associated domain